MTNSRMTNDECRAWLGHSSFEVRSSFKTAGDRLIFRSPRNKMCLSPFRSGFETPSSHSSFGRGMS